MLTDKTVEMVSNYVKHFEELNFTDHSVYDEWISLAYGPKWNCKSGLSKEEQDRIEVLLSEVKSFNHCGEERYEVVFSFIKFLFSNPKYRWDETDEQWYSDFKKHYIDGEPQEAWIDVPNNELDFFEVHMKIETFNKILPIRLRLLREYLGGFDTLN